MGWFGRNKIQKQAENALQRQRREYEIRKTLLFEACRTRARQIVTDESRANRVGAFAANLLTGESHPPEQLEQIDQDSRAISQGIADEILADAEMRDYVGDTIFWLAEALVSQGFDSKTHVQSAESIARAKELVQLARDRAGDKPLYFALLSQIQMSANEPKKAYSSAKRGASKLPVSVLSDDEKTRILRSELLRLQANAAVALDRVEEARFLYQAAKDFNPKIQGVDDALRSLSRR
jgi:tetratricopeptide (TPR) repeat protein